MDNLIEVEAYDTVLYAEDILRCIELSKEKLQTIRLKSRKDGFKFSQIDITPTMTLADCIGNLQLIYYNHP